ncbi:unnamed protein product [Menidia menidia]|uniref:(Atlantic silverside) hypothetical protein n=1 Tax=Menidia menidia TaxID=238744 RepID=A0A8S4AXT9_9TELE|nr:unnamed protein product [Menidia menidia]
MAKEGVRDEDADKQKASPDVNRSPDRHSVVGFVIQNTNKKPQGMKGAMCKEGYHGLRCDQFVPKTDAILSDPTDELGIEFMESGDTYQRQVLSIFSIASGICLLGVACMALYRRNKKHREKLQAHFSETRSLRDCSVNASGLMSKSTLKLQYSLHLQKGCNAHGASLTGGNVTPGTSSATPPILSKALSKGKRFRSSSLSLSPAQQRREATHFRTPPISRGRNKVTTNLIDGSRVVGHVYKHLQEDESTDTESIRRCDSATGRIGTFLTKTPLTNFTARKGWMEVPCTRLDKATTLLPSSMRTRSVPIIPSLQACDSETEHVHSGEQNQPGPIKWHPALAGKIEPPVSNPSSQPETVMLMNSVLPRNVSPPAITCNPLESEDIRSANAPCPFEFSAEFSKDFNQKHLSNPKKTSGFCIEFHHHGKNMLEAGTVQESEEGNVQYSTRALHTGSATRGLKASGQKEVKGQCQGQTSLVKGGANCFLATKGPSCRVTGNTYAKPSAS